MTTTTRPPAARDTARLTPIRPMGIVIPAGDPTAAPRAADVEHARALRDRVRTRDGFVDVLLFRAGGEMFALELVEVEEALDLPELNPLPEMPRGMLGVFPLRGTLLATFDASVLLGVSSGAAATTLVLRGEERRVALAVEDVEDVATLPLDAMRLPPIVETDGLLLGVFTHGPRLVGLLDASVVLDACRSDIALENA